MRYARLQPILALVVLATTGACGGGSSGGATTPPPPAPPPSADGVTFDLGAAANGGAIARLSGSSSTGRFGVPVAGGFDCDGDGLPDYAMSAMQAAPFGRTGAGEVKLVFGDGAFTDLDTATAPARVLTIAGAGPHEATGSEIWMDDVTGDGLGDLLIGRQNYREPTTGRIGAGALTVLTGGPVLRDLATTGTTLDLAAPPATVSVLTIVGAAELDRFGMWMRTGDVSGDGIADVLVGADQEDGNGERNRGAAYLVRGGMHLSDTATIDLAGFGATALAGHLIRITPPGGATDYHFGATVALADLDDNGRAEILVAASLSRVGGLLVADGAPADSAVRNGGNPGGSLFIVWDDNVDTGTSWPAGHAFAVDAAPGSVTRIDGGTAAGVYENDRFGEEILGGRDYDGDGRADLFTGDIHGNARDGEVWAGVGHVFFGAADLRGLEFSMSDVPDHVTVTTLLGPSAGAISSDTSLHGDIDGDGLTDLAIASPLAAPLGRIEAGVIHVLWGQPGPWPAVIDLGDGARPDESVFAITDILGARGAQSADDAGDTLMYSAVGADMNGDGHTDLVVNEMRGNGTAADALDVGNLLIVDGTAIPRP